MKKLFEYGISLSLLAALVPLSAAADTFFTDNFSNGSTINSATPANPTSDSASYQTISAKSWSPTPSLSDNNLQFGIATTSGGVIEIQAQFATNAVALTENGDYIQMVITFTNTAGLLTANGFLGFGLYNSGGVQPVAGGMNGTASSGSTSEATGGAQNWQGYVGQIAFTGSKSQIMNRSAQTGTDNRNQELVTSGSGSESYGNPKAATVGSASTTPSLTLTAGATYTEVLTITLTDVNTLAITNSLYSGSDTNGTLLTQFGGVASGSTYLTSGFDAFAVGWYEKGSQATTMSISSIAISGHTTVISSPPSITVEPASASAPVGALVPFTVSANGFNMTYQWHRNGTNLVDGGDISGSTSSTLIISPVSAADVAANYYVTITGAGNYSTNSTTASLSLTTAANLVWAGNSAVWDLNNTADWHDPNNNLTTFNYGDPVTFNDTGVGNTIVSMTGQYLSAGSVTVNNSSAGYDFAGTGSIAGPGYLLYEGSAPLEIDNANTYTGGTIISNAAAYLILSNYAGLGTGPITLAQAGGTMEIMPSGGASSGLSGDLVVADDFTIQLDGSGSYAGVFFGNFSGTAGKTLTLNPSNLSNTNRYRAYGDNTIFDANLVLNGAAVANANYFGTALAPYNSSGAQIYNGIISGNGGLVQRASGMTVLNGANTYSGGTTPTTGVIGLGTDSTGNPVTAGPIGIGPLYLSPEVPDATGSGMILAFGGAHTIANSIEYPSATNNLTLIIGGTNNLTLAGPFSLNGDDGLGSQTTRTLQVTNTGLTTISGVISDGGHGFSLTKTGNGILALNNNETYTGPTTIGGGTLLVNGSLNAASSVTVTSGLLGGTGTIGGAVTAQNGGGIAPGNNGIGTLTINNALTLQSGSTNVIEVNKGAGSAHDLVVANSITYGGTLLVTNLSGDITTSDTFQVFNVSGAKTGNFSSIAGSPGAGLAWSFDPTNGLLSVVTGVNTNPTNIVFSVSSGNLVLSWPSDHIGWELQMQTNSLATGLSTNWTTVDNSTNVDQVTLPLNPANGATFFRLVYP